MRRKEVKESKILSPMNGREMKKKRGKEMNGEKRNVAQENDDIINLSPLTRIIFPENDDSVLNYICDDGHMVEPDLSLFSAHYNLILYPPYTYLYFIVHRT